MGDAVTQLLGLAILLGNLGQLVDELGDLVVFHFGKPV